MSVLPPSSLDPSLISCFFLAHSPAPSSYIQSLLLPHSLPTPSSFIPCSFLTYSSTPSLQHMRAWCAEMLLLRYNWALSATALDTLWALIVSIYLVGGVLGSACAGWAANRLGRRGCLLLSGFLLLLAAIGFYCCRWLQSVELLLLSRLVVGLGGGLVSTSLPMYHSEIAAFSQRGTLGVCCSVGFSIGMVVAQIFTLQSLFGTEQLWHVALSFYVVFLAIGYAPFALYPESPKWLFIVKQQREQALQTLRRLRGSEQGQLQEVQAMELEAGSKCSSRGLLQLLRDSRMQLPLILLCAYQGGQQLTGCSSVSGGFLLLSLSSKSSLLSLLSLPPPLDLLLLRVHLQQQWHSSTHL